MRRYHHLLIGCVLSLGCSKPVAPPPVIALSQTGDTLIAAGIAGIASGYGLSGDRWALLANENNEVLLADFAAHTVGNFPLMTRAEVANPSTLFGEGDTIVVGDWGLRRFTRWTPGKPRLEAIPVPQVLGGALPRATDAAGNWYFQIAPRVAGGSGGKRDSAVIVRADAFFTHFDTVAALSPIESAKVEDGYGAATIPLALAGEDRWGVLAGGIVWIARHYQNRIDWYPVTGKASSGPLLPDPLLTVSPMDREIYLRRFPKDQQDNARSSLQWAAIKPPFERVFPGPDGLMWLFKSAPALDSVRQFQVVDSTGVKRYVSIPSRGVALAITTEAILMGEEFPGGVRLLRYHLTEAALTGLPDPVTQGTESPSR